MPSYPVLYLERGVIGYTTKTPAELLPLLEDLVQDNEAYLLSHPNAPHPYQSRVRYQREKRGQERWLGVRRLLRKRRGDCEDLAAYLAAWYRVRMGIHAKVVLIRFAKYGTVWYHAVVLLPDGSIKDPSKALGM